MVRTRLTWLACAVAVSLGAAPSAYAQAPALDTIVRWWTFHRLNAGAVGEEQLGPERIQLGGVVRESYDFGGLRLFPPGAAPNAGAELFANDTGETYWVSTVAPSGNLNPGAPIGSSVQLLQYQYFRKDDANAHLQLVVSRTWLEAIDANGGLPTALECPWHEPLDSYVECQRVMWAWVSFDVTASSFDQQVLLKTGGFAELSGWTADWYFDARTNHDATVPFWNSLNFDVDRDVDGAGTGLHAIASLPSSITIDVPLSSVGVGDLFYVSASVKASTLNRRQRESYLSAYFRDPQQSDGLAFSFAGLEPVETPAEKPQPIAPTPAPPCTTGPRRTAGILRFSAPAYSEPELPGDGATIVVTRTGGKRGAVSATLTASGGTAVGGVDYTPVTTHVLFADGEDGSRAVHIPILGDGEAESDKTVNLTLSDPRGCATLGNRSSAVLTILDDDRPIVLPPTYTVGGTVTGLVGSGLVLDEIMTGSELTPTNGPFAFGYAFPSGRSYDVHVGSQPDNPLQVCTVTNGAGTVADADVTNVTVVCVTPLPNGALDPTFGGDGKVTLPGATSASAVALQPDGKIVVVGGKILARFETDGTLDAGFGTGGQVAIVFNVGLLDTAQAVALQPDGKILVAGFTRARDDFALARYNADGSPDLAFGTGGSVSTDFNASVDQAWAVLFQTDGRIVVAGHAATASPLGQDNDFAVARYTSAGALDGSFGSGGKATTNVAGRTDLAHAAVLQPDGRIVLAGRVADGGGDNPDVGLVRYDTDGHPDASFGVGGIVRRDVSSGSWDEASDLALQADGKIVVAVQAFVSPTFQFALARFDGSGNLDSGFGTEGVATTAFSTLNDYARAVAVQGDGKIVVAGQSSNLLNSDLAVARHNVDGSLDATFDGDGKVTVDFAGARDGGECVAIQPDGKIIAGGFATDGTSNTIFFVRLVP